MQKALQERRPIVQGLITKFLILVVPLSLLLSISGTFLLVKHDFRHAHDNLAARIGNQAARVTTLLSRHGGLEDGQLAQDLLALLSDDRAFRCAELRVLGEDRAYATMPANLGCTGHGDAESLTLPVGELSVATLTVWFGDSELADYRYERQALTQMVMVLGFLLPVLAAVVGFRLVVNRPLKKLLTAIRRSTETGVRTPVDYRSNDEFDVVFSAFDRMLEREVDRERALKEANSALSASEEKLRVLNEELEARIQARTIQLQEREAALSESQQRFRHFAEASSDWYWEMDESLRFSYFSDRFTDVTGVPPKMLLGKTREETGIPGVDPEAWQRHLSDLAERRPFRGFVHPRTKANGEEVWLSISGLPYFDHDGAFKGYRGVGANITRLKEAEDELRMSRDKLKESERALIEAQLTAKIGSWRWSLERSSLISCSEGFAHIHGVTMDEINELMDHQMERVVHPEDRARVEEKIRRADAAKLDYEIEYRILLPDGQVRHVVEICNQIVDDSGQVREQVGTVQDITDRKNLELALLSAKDEAESSSRAKSQFLAKMSHEIRTPMNGVLGTTDLLLRTELTDHQRRLTETAHQSAENLLHLINDILDLSKVEAGKLELHCRDFDLREVVAEVCILATATKKDKDLEVSQFIDPGIPERLHGDPDRLRQILINLVGNAIKFTDEGQVSVRVERQGMDDMFVIAFEVADTGIGLTAEAIDRVLKPFEQDTQSTGHRYGGTGLGLAISKQLIEMMGGELAIESRPGQGSTIRFALHLEATDQRSLPQIADEDMELESNLNAAVLLAEDNPVNQMIAEEYLSAMGCHVQVVPNGKEAVAAFRRRAYDLILMDCDMPEMDGIEATKSIRQFEMDENRQQPTPIIALTAYAFEEDQQRCMAAGMDDFLGKPFDPKSLQAVLKRWLTHDDQISTLSERHVAL